MAASLRTQLEEWGRSSFEQVEKTLGARRDAAGSHSGRRSGAKHWADDAVTQLARSRQRRRYRHMRTVKTPTLSASSRAAAEYLDGQRTEMRSAGGAPLDKLTGEWSFLDSRAPSRDGSALPARARSQASRQSARAKSGRSGRSGRGSRSAAGRATSAAGSVGGRSRQEEIERMRSTIRDIKTACVALPCPGARAPPAHLLTHELQLCPQRDGRLRRRVLCRGCARSAVGGPAAAGVHGGRAAGGDCATAAAGWRAHVR